MASVELTDTSNAKAREANLDVEGQPPSYTERDNVASNGDGLPTYTQAQNQLNEPPPSYESVFGRVKQAKRESSGLVSFFKTTVVIILSTVGFTILLGIFMAIPVSMIIMGAIHIDNCRAEKMIPIYLVVAGSFGAAKNLYSVVQRCRKQKEELEEEQGKVNPFEGIVNCFMFGWFIAGCVWIYRTTDRDPENTGAGNYCDPTLYYFAFWITTAVYILMAASCCCMCTIGCLAALFSGKK